MSQVQVKKSFLWAAVLASALLLPAHDADAAARRLAFDPDYGAPFASLGWRGDAVVEFAEGSCDGPGEVNNVFGGCAGTMSFTSGTVELYDNADPLKTTLQSMNFTGGQVFSMTFDGSNELTQVISTPFVPVAGNISQTQYMGNQAYFSLVFVGEYAQLIWFKNNPGSFLVDPLVPPYLNLPAVVSYFGCYAAGPGDNKVGSNNCGLSSNLDGAGAKFTVTVVPEPQTYALMLFGLGALAFAARRRRSSML